MQSQWIEHKGTRIFYANYSGFGDNIVAFEQEIKDASEILATQPAKSVFVLSNTEGNSTTYAHLNILRKYIPTTNPAVIKRAMLGITATQKIFVTTFANTFGDVRSQAFSSQEEALDWLVKDLKPKEENTVSAQPSRPVSSAKAMQSYWVEGLGKRVFVANFSNFGTNADDLKAECELIKVVLRKEPLDSVLAITDITGTNATPQTLQTLRELVTETNQFVHKRAVVGLSGYKKYFVDAFAAFTGENTFVRHDTLQQALDWITRAT
jgi:hypothetical protein